MAGGYPGNHLFLVEGDPGTGKTTLALQFLLEGVRRGERGLYITLSETLTTSLPAFIVVMTFLYQYRSQCIPQLRVPCGTVRVCASFSVLDWPEFWLRVSPINRLRRVEPKLRTKTHQRRAVSAR
jgi:hypothetical protein